MSIRVSLLDLHNGRKGQVIIMAVGDDHRIHNRYIINLARHVGVTFRTEERDWAATVLEDGIKENA
jgi:hypothetical protein